MIHVVCHWLTKYRNGLAIASLSLTLLLALGLKNLYLNTNYTLFFDSDDAQKLAHESQQAEFTKTDNLALLIQPNNGESLFTQANLAAIRWVTEQAWNVPHSIRVDSLTNFQHSYALGDDLVVEDLVSAPEAYSEQQLDFLKSVAVSDARLSKRILSSDASTTLINISVELPPYPEEGMAHVQRVRALASRDQAIRDIAEYGEKLQAKIGERYPALTVHLLGETIINHSLAKASEQDGTTLIPLMLLAIALLLGVLLRSLVSIFVTLVVIVLAIVASMGVIGWAGSALNMVNVVAPIIILTIAVCDSVHLLSNYLDELSRGGTSVDSMRRSLSINLQPIFITSITTAVGFLSLNFSASPPFRELGNVCAFGVMYAMLLTVCLLPALCILFLKSSRSSVMTNRYADLLAGIVINNRQLALTSALVFAVLAFAFIPRNQIDDDPARYFKASNAYRAAVDFSQQTLPGINDINFSLDCGSASCIYEPDFLQQVDEFRVWLLSQPKVESVISYVEVIKKINSNFRADDVREYRIPASAEEVAQYTLIYELSLPFGLDMNTLTNLDKSSIRLTAFTRQTTTGEFLALEAAASAWLSSRAITEQPRGSSIRMMFATLGENNINGMLWGALMALIGVTLTIFVSLRSLTYSAISVVVNSFPALIALGVWGLLVAHINMAVAVVFSVTLGIIVDDSVHFICKYRLAREQYNHSPDGAVQYAFRHVGKALLVTTLVLATGFSLLCFSSFNLNAYLGALTAMTVVIALIFDYLVLPPLLLMIPPK